MAVLESGWVPISGSVDQGADVESKFDVAFGNIDTFITESYQPKAYNSLLPTLTVDKPAYVEGRVYYNSDKGTFNGMCKFAGVEVAFGHMQHTHVINESGVSIPKGRAVRHNGVNIDGKVRVVPADATSFVNAEIYGVTQQEILNTEEGAIVTSGEIDTLDTSSNPAGVPLYLDETGNGTFTDVAPAIKSQVGGIKVSDAVNGVLQVSIISNKNTPTIFGGMQGQLDTGLGVGVYDLTAVAQDIGDYATEKEVVMTVDAPTGKITLPNVGEYRVHFTGGISFTSLASTRTVYVELYDETNTEVHFTYAKNIPRDATEDSLGFSWPIDELDGNVHKMRIRSVPDMTITLDEVSFDIQSVSIS